MGKEIIVNNLNWYKGEEFLYFAFGDFNSKDYNIYRTSDGNRFSHSLAPSMKDVTVDVNGNDGQYYFGTLHKSKVFDISFAFDGLTIDQIRNIKAVFSEKELKELYLFENIEDCTFDKLGKVTNINRGIYMVKVTGQPNIKYIPFSNDKGETVYKGEGSVQFTAYWPYSRGKTPQKVGGRVDTTGLEPDREGTYETFELTNNGDIPSYLIFESSGVNVKILEFVDQNNVISTTNGFTYWDSKTGIVKNNQTTIEYSGNGVFQLPCDTTEVYVTIPRDQEGEVFFKYYNWYY